MSFRDKLATAFIALMVPVSLSLWVPDGGYALFGWATATPQPALALRVEPASSLAGSRFDQAQGVGQ